MTFRRWLLLGAALFGVLGAATLTLAVSCILDVIGGQCELWLLGPFVALPLGLGLGLIGRAAGPPVVSENPESGQLQGCGEREET